MTGRQLQKLLILNLPYAFLGLLATKLGAAWRFAEGIDFSTKFLHLREGLFVSFCSPLPSFQAVDLLFGLVFGCALRLIVYEKAETRRSIDATRNTVPPDGESPVTSRHSLIQIHGTM